MQTCNYYKYLHNKFCWPPIATPHVQWPIFQLALSTRFNQSKCRFLIKYIHEWLPLQDWYHIKSLSNDPLCPSCHSGKEMAQNFLECPHPDCQQVWKDLHHTIQKHSIKNNLSTLYNLIKHIYINGNQPNPPSVQSQYQWTNQQPKLRQRWDGNKCTMAGTHPDGSRCVPASTQPPTAPITLPKLLP